VEKRCESPAACTLATLIAHVLEQLSIHGCGGVSHGTFNSDPALSYYVCTPSWIPRRFGLHSSAAHLLEQIRQRRGRCFRPHWESRSLSAVGSATDYDGNTVRPMVTAP